MLDLIQDYLNNHQGSLVGISALADHCGISEGELYVILHHARFKLVKKYTNYALGSEPQTDVAVYIDNTDSIHYLCNTQQL